MRRQLDIFTAPAANKPWKYHPGAGNHSRFWGEDKLFPDTFYNPYSARICTLDMFVTFDVYLVTYPNGGRSRRFLAHFHEPIKSTQQGMDMVDRWIQTQALPDIVPNWAVKHRQACRRGKHNKADIS